jgi:hypothetical protein
MFEAEHQPVHGRLVGRFGFHGDRAHAGPSDKCPQKVR